MANPIKDRRKTNFIIACGYCLVASIILFNYLTKTSNQEPYHRESARQANASREIAPAEIDLEKQLKEQKRINQEMRAMLLKLQNSNRSGIDNRVLPAKPMYSKGLESESPEAELPIKNLEINQLNIPELNPLLDTKFNKNTNCPFVFGRNPFASPVKAAAVSENNAKAFSEHAVVCDPRLPYVFTVNNSHLRVISNY